MTTTQSDNQLKGDPKVVAALNVAVKNELTAVHQYLVHAHLLDDWGFVKRSKSYQEEVNEERGHADQLIQRILLLGGEPNVQEIGEVLKGNSLESVIRNDLKIEMDGIAHYRKAIAIAEEADDYVTRDLLIHILEDEEGHQDHLNTELDLIETLGLENFAQLQV